MKSPSVSFPFALPLPFPFSLQRLFLALLPESRSSSSSSKAPPVAVAVASSKKEKEMETCLTVAEIVEEMSPHTIRTIWNDGSDEDDGRRRRRRHPEVRFEFVLQYMEAVASTHETNEDLNSLATYPLLYGSLKDSIAEVIEQLPRDLRPRICSFLLMMLVNIAVRNDDEKDNCHRCTPPRGLGARILLETMLKTDAHLAFYLYRELATHRRLWEQNARGMALVGWFLVQSMDILGGHALNAWLDLLYPFLYGQHHHRTGSGCAAAAAAAKKQEAEPADDDGAKVEAVVNALLLLTGRLPMLEQKCNLKETNPPMLLPSLLMACFTRSSLQRNRAHIGQLQRAYEEFKEFSIRSGFSATLFEAMLECMNRDGPKLKDESLRFVVECLCQREEALAIWERIYPSVIVPSQYIIRFLEKNWQVYRLQLAPNKAAWKKFAATVHVENAKKAGLKEREWSRSSVKSVGRYKLLDNDIIVQNMASDLSQLNRPWEMVRASVGGYYDLVRSHGERLVSAVTELRERTLLWILARVKVLQGSGGGVPMAGGFSHPVTVGIPLSVRSRVYYYYSSAMPVIVTSRIG